MGGNCLTGKLKRALYGSYFLLTFVLLTACLSVTPVPLDTPEPTVTSTTAPSPTATIVWFPPTSTYTPRPTRSVSSPTPEPQAPHGDLILEDNFDSPESWHLSQTSSGKIAVGNNRINIAIDQPRLLLSSLRSAPIIGDFYLEIISQTNLCTDKDEYGVLIRAASQADFLRFSLSCDGQVRLDRITGGSASSPQPWELSGAVPPGAPAVSRIGVWAQGNELRFYVNDEYQFSINEPVLLSGQIGVFARSAGDSPVSVSFSSLKLFRPGP